MKKLIRYIGAILSNAILGGVTVFTGGAVLVGLYKFVNNTMAGNVIAAILIGSGLLIIIWLIADVGKSIKDKVNKRDKECR